ncbi:MAG: hypothetical protein MUC50_09055 [Myxococcota bacterium]|nr:hypothetical protein [Myxococcota bacterium]
MKTHFCPTAAYLAWGCAFIAGSSGCSAAIGLDDLTFDLDSSGGGTGGGTDGGTDTQTNTDKHETDTDTRTDGGDSDTGTLNDCEGVIRIPLHLCRIPTPLQSKPRRS